MSDTRNRGPILAAIGVLFTLIVGVVTDAHIAAWVLVGILLVFAALRIVFDDSRGFAVRSRPTDVTVLVLSAGALIFLAQTAPDLY